MLDKEELVPAYTLPSVLDGVTTAFDWVNFRRVEILRQYRKEMYGTIPPRSDAMTCELLTRKDNALGDTAIRKEIRVTFSMDNGEHRAMNVLLYLPKNASGPVPVFLGLNFKGNQNCTPETDVMPTGYRNDGSPVSTERGEQIHRWDVAEAVRRGYATATANYFDLFPDSHEPDSWKRSIYGMFHPGWTPEKMHETGTAISAWAWGLSRMLDCLEREEGINASAAIVHGHSRLGKTALWAGANDPRFRFVISNDSGCCGAALSRRCFGETFEAITERFPHWFVPGLRAYANREHEFPLEQHFLISLMAPRPVAIASATDDLWSDPRGEFLSGVHARDVYRLFGSESTGTDVMPAPATYLTAPVSYHLRVGKHDQTPFDWKHYFDLADRWFHTGR